MRQRGGVGLGDDLFCSAVPFSKALLLDTAVVKLKLSNDVTRQLHPARADVPAHAMCSIVLSCLLSVTDGAEGTASTSEVLTVPSTLASAGTWAHRANLGGKGEWFESVAMVISSDRRVLVAFVQSIFMCLEELSYFVHTNSILHSSTYIKRLHTYMHALKRMYTRIRAQNIHAFTRACAREHTHTQSQRYDDRIIVTVTSRDHQATSLPP